MGFEIDTIDLSMADTNTGMYMTGNVYYVDGVTDGLGNNRPLSVGQLVMAICLQRASQLENSILAMMNKMSITSEELSALTTIEEAIVGKTSGTVDMSQTVTVDGHSYTYTEFLESSSIGITVPSGDINVYDASQLVSDIETKMDSLNSMNQKDMIQLQSDTNKRDQSYDMISNILKSLQTTMIGIMNNY